MKKYLGVLILATALLTGCSAETEQLVSEATVQTEIAETTAISEAEVSASPSEDNKNFIGFRLYSNALTLKEQQLVVGSEEALERCTYLFGEDECRKLTEWAENFDFDKQAVAMRVFADCCSSDKFTINNIYAEKGEIIFDYDYERPETHTEDIICYVIAGVVPKSDLSFLENDDEWGVTLSAEYDSNTHTVSGSFFQWGERNITELLSGSWYELERYDKKDGWCKVPYSSKFDGAEICWTLEGWIIPEYGQRTFEENLALYDKLENGKYRIAKSIFDLPDPEKSHTYYAEFEVE